MSLKESTEKLKDVSLFAGCSKRELQRIAKIGDESTVEAGRILMEQGDAGRQAFVILEGTATVRRGGRKVGELGPGDTAGELALLDRGPRTAQVRATTNMRVLVLTASGLMGLLDETPNMAAKLLTSLASRVRELDRKIYG